jgi:hypothetical protein
MGLPAPARDLVLQRYNGVRGQAASFDALVRHYEACG